MTAGMTVAATAMTVAMAGDIAVNSSYVPSGTCASHLAQVFLWHIGISPKYKIS
jgi:hypothetical protein